jgi:hypothetical protein
VKRHGGLAALALCAALAASAANARAGEITIFSCHDPGGDAVGHDGWGNQRTADTNMIAADSCAGGGAGSLWLEVGANWAGYGDGARTEWVFSAPAWASISSYTLNLTGSYAIPSTGGGSGQAFINASDESDPNYDYRNLGAATQGPWVIARTPPAPVNVLRFNASCDGQSGPCPANSRIASIGLTRATIVLRDATSPTVGSLTGSLLPASTVRGTAETNFTAADAGPGVYSAQLTIDGAPQAPVLLDANGGWCKDLGQSSDGTRSFAHPDPCAQSTGGAVALDTTGLADGEHAVRLSVDDASGNSTTAFNSTFTSHNAPLSTAAPALDTSDGTSAGSTFSASTGAWSAPAGAGGISYGYQWQDCDSHGGECRDIAGARAASYTASAGEIGHTLRVLVSASDRDGLASAPSAVTQTILAPPGSGPTASPPGASTPNGAGASERATVHLSSPGTLARSYAHSALALSGSLTGPDGQPIAGATLDVLEAAAGGRTRVLARVSSSPQGTFTVHVAGGPSRAIRVAYRAYSNDLEYAASAQVTESVRAAVALRVTPRHTTPTGIITLRGHVYGSVPRSGVIVELLVHYRGAWEPFRTPHTDSHGNFRVRYQFQGATGRFPFRAEVPGGQAGFAYANGRSSPMTVRSG